MEKIKAATTDISATPWQKHEVALLREIARLMGKSLNPEKVIREMLHLLSEWLGLNRGRVLLLADKQNDSHPGKLAIRYAYGLTPEEIQKGRFSPGEGLTGRVFSTGQLCVVQDIDQDPDYLYRTIERSQLPTETVAFIALPIQQESKTIGVLAVQRLRSRQRALNDDIEILKTIATLIGQVLRIHEEVARRTASLQAENQTLRQQLQRYDGQHGILGNSAPMLTCLSQVERLGPTDISVLILGESGTGKEVFARALHNASARKNAPFVKVNCAAIPESLFESEMFGYEKGAFTGAGNAQQGRFEQAQGGTLFLDEVGEIPLAQQSKLLRVLQDRTVTRVGGRKETTLDIRVLAATNRNLSKEVAQGNFRLDLFYRLSVVSMKLPSLRERGADIALLISHYLHQASLTYQRTLRLKPDALAMLRNYDWPGNIRQLQNLMTRLVLMSSQEEIGCEDIRQHLAEEVMLRPADHFGVIVAETPEQPAEPALTRAYFEVHSHNDAALRSALETAKGNKSKAAQGLGLTRRQFIYRLEKLGIH
ncbi:MAG: sigma 54-interacting transcriptional regulator [Burkholderiales bacterium]|nr:sigma 54-interacting transcriptional regulator [Burkholderiales bacterium]